MGLYSDIKKLSDHKNVSMDENFYTQIDKWKALYSGYLAEHHEYMDFNIEKGKHRKTRHTLGMPKVVTEEIATLIYNEKVQISISEKEKETSDVNEFIQQVLKANKFNTKFPELLEKMFALGGAVLKPYVDEQGIKLQFVTADAFIPISYSATGEIDEGVFITEQVKGQYRYTHLEWYIKDEDGVYAIEHDLYRTDKNKEDELGIKVELQELYPDMQFDVWRFPGVTRPMFVYLKPNIANNIDFSSPLGISLYANAMDTMKAIDIAFDSFIREFRLGKKRIMVPRQALRTVVDPETGEFKRYFDASDEVFQGYDAGPGNEKIEDMSVELRVDEHISAVNALLNLFAMQTGFSAGSFSFDGQSVKTATEVVSENSKTFRTKQSHEVVIEDALKHLIHVIVEMEKVFGEQDFTTSEFEITVQFDDSIAQDRTADGAFYVSMVTSGLMSKMKAMMLQFGYSKEEAQKEIEQMQKENGSVEAEQVDEFGLE